MGLNPESTPLLEKIGAVPVLWHPHAWDQLDAKLLANCPFRDVGVIFAIPAFGKYVRADTPQRYIHSLIVFDLERDDVIDSPQAGYDHAAGLQVHERFALFMPQEGVPVDHDNQSIAVLL